MGRSHAGHPHTGRIVEYTLTERDADDVNRRRAVYPGGNWVEPGETYPLLVVRAWPGTDDVNGQVMLDGPDALWVTVVEFGTGPGRWHGYGEHEFHDVGHDSSFAGQPDCVPARDALTAAAVTSTAAASAGRR